MKFVTNQGNYEQAMNKEQRMNILLRDKYQCQGCGNVSSLEVHHVFYGNNRKFSDKYEECMVTLCHKCHHGIHSIGKLENRELDNKLKQMCQRRFEEQYGHERFIQECGQNYL